MADKNIRSADPRNYQLPGSVSLWFRKAGSTDDADWKDLGNVINPSLEEALEELKHFSNRRQERSVDKEVVSQREATMKFSVDEINSHNLKFAMMNGEDSEDSTYDANFNEIVLNPGASNTIQLKQTNIGGVVVRSPGLEDEVTFASPADYTVDLTTGILTITPAGGLDDPEETELHIFYTKTVSAEKFEIFPGQSVTGQAKFQVFTPGGIKYAIEFGNVVIRANGALAVGDGTNWQEIPLQLDVLVDNAGELGHMYVIDDEEVAE